MPDELDDVNAGEGPVTPGFLALADLAKAWLRTVLPGLYSALILWASSAINLPQSLQDWLGTVGPVLLFPIILAVVYPLFRLVEKSKKVPDWLVRIFLGSARRPVYVKSAVADSIDAGNDVALVGTSTTPAGE